MRCVIIKDTGGRRWFWCETGTGLDWLNTQTDIWVYDTRSQAERVVKAARLGKQHARIIPFDTITTSRKGY